MKKYCFLLSLALAALFASCEPTPNEPSTKPGTTYPRIQLIEHFTGEDCGFCPNGMDAIYKVYSQNPDSFVWVSHHDGYYPDEYTIAASSKIVSKLGVSGAPSVSLNRTKRLGGYAYSPSSLKSAYASAARTATTMITLSRTYDAASGKLHVTVNGITSEESLSKVKLSLGVTESGLNGYQHDYYLEDSWEGWSEFTHTHVIRVMATAALGDQVEISEQKFTADYDITIKSAWNADNCQIVAWVTAESTDMPVLNAAKLPVVEGTKGGEDIKHGGVTKFEPTFEYPEESSVTPAAEVEFASVSVKVDSLVSGYNTFVISGRTADPVLTVQNIGVYGYFSATVYAEKSATLPAGTYTISDTKAPGNVAAGTRDDVQLKTGGSSFQYIYQNQGSWYTYVYWFMNEGQMVVAEDGSFTISFTSRNGSSVKISYAAPAATTEVPFAAPQDLRSRMSYSLADGICPADMLLVR